MGLAIVEFKGTISAVTGSGRFGMIDPEPKYAEKLDNLPVVISSDTKGRLTLMNGKGELEPGERVKGRAVRGPEAFAALVVSLADQENTTEKA